MTSKKRGVPRQVSKDRTTLHSRPTGIRGMDRLIPGGFPEGHVILLAGKAGAGKTILCMEWLFKGFGTYAEPGIYLTLTESITKAIRNVKAMSFFDESLRGPTQVHFTDFRTLARLQGITDKAMGPKQVEQLLGAIEELVKQTGVKRLVIDSVTALAYLIQDKSLIRTFIFRLGNLLSNLECTTILTSEVQGQGYGVFGVEEFISDGIITLSYDVKSNELTRVIRIAKMRGVSYNTRVTTFSIDSHGLKFYCIPARDFSYSSSLKRLSTGIDGLDDMLKGGLFKASSTLLAGSTGAGKSIMCLQYIMEGLKNNEPCLYVSFEESHDQIIRNANVLGWDLRKYEKKGLLDLICTPPNKNYPMSHFVAIEELLGRNPKIRVVIDSFSALEKVFPEEEFREILLLIIPVLKAHGATTLMTSASTSLMGTDRLTESHISTVTDNIILLKYVEQGGRLRTVISTLKSRGSGHDTNLKSYQVTDKGIVIGESLNAYEGIMTGSAKRTGKLASEKIREEFAYTLGIMGPKTFDKVCQNGLDKDHLFEFIDALAANGIMKKEDTESFRNRINSILVDQEK